MDHAQADQAADEPPGRDAVRARIQGLTGDQVNDLLQQSTTPAEARAILNVATQAQLHQVADLNYIDHQRSRTGITRDLLAARYPIHEHHQAVQAEEAGREVVRHDSSRDDWHAEADLGDEL
jgi:hypothetical protein